MQPRPILWSVSILGCLPSSGGLPLPEPWTLLLNHFPSLLSSCYECLIFYKKVSVTHVAFIINTEVTESQNLSIGKTFKQHCNSKSIHCMNPHCSILPDVHQLPCKHFHHQKTHYSQFGIFFFFFIVSQNLPL